MRNVPIEVLSKSQGEKVSPDYWGEGDESPVLGKVSYRAGNNQDRCKADDSGRTHSKPVDGDRREQSKHGTV